MNLLIFIIVVLIVMILVLYAVSLIPLSGPPMIKNLIMAAVVLVFAVFIANRAGVF